MHFYQKPFANYKIECDVTLGRSIKDLQKQFSLDQKEDSAFFEFIGKFRGSGPTTLLVVTMIVVPFSCGMCVPFIFFTVAGIFIKYLTLTMRSTDEIEKLVEIQSNPDWINDCLEPQN